MAQLEVSMDSTEPTVATETLADADMPASGNPDMTISARQVFGVDTNMEIPAFSEHTIHVPELDESYRFDHDTTLAILAGFAHNRRVLIQGYHGTGKTTHIEQVAARLNWPCIRINLDSHISRIDLIGKDAIVLRDGKQVTEFREGLLPWTLQHPCTLVFDEYDAGRPDVMFVIQRVLEADSKLTLLDQNTVITPHPSFRLFATSNTVGLGDTTGLYHGTQQINQAQMDRWNIVTTLNYLPHEQEVDIVLSKSPDYDNEEGRRTVAAMVATAELTRNGKKVEPLCRCIFPPRNTLRPYCTGTLRCASVNSTMKYMIPKPKTASSSRPPVWSLIRNPRPMTEGRFATMPPNMISDMPFPSPRSVISSPSHTRNMVPATMEMTMVSVCRFSPKSTVGSTPDCCSRVNVPYDWRKAIGTVSQWVSWLIRCRPYSPSWANALRFGSTGVRICITMDAVM